MNIPLEKWLVMGALTIISIFLGILPYFIVRYSKSMLQTESFMYKIVLTALSCFGAGVLFSTSMLHLLPEVREAFKNATTSVDPHFPLAEVMVISGFLLIYFVEEVAHFIMVDGHHGHHHHMNTVARHNSIAHSIPIPNAKGSTYSLNTPRGSISTIHTLQPSQQQRPSFCITIPEDSTVQGESSGNAKSIINNNISTMDVTSTGAGQMPNDSQRERRYSQYSVKDMRISESMETMEEECPDDKTNFASSLRAVLALIALSFHAIMEGVTIGLQNSSNVWLMFGAVASHKFVISFCMGLELVATQTKALTFVSSIVFFAIVSPIGIVIGSLLASDASDKSVATTVIEGMACGTLLYVVFFEILNRERERKSYSMSNSKAIGFIQFIALALGLVAMGCLVTLTHSHGSDDDADDHGHPHPH